MENTKGSLIALAGGAIIAACLFGAPAQAENDKAAKRAAVIEYWTSARRAAAQPRDMVIDHRGLGYLRRADGSLQPHGHQIEAQDQAGPTPRAKPDGGGGNNDTEAPVIDSNSLDPSAGSTIGDSHTFSADVTDNAGVRSVDFVITYQDGSNTQTFAASNTGGNTWSLNLSGFTSGNWSWQVIAQDTAKRGGNTAQSSQTSFTVQTDGGGGGGGGSDGDTVTNEIYTAGANEDIRYATGRLFYEMPSNPRRKRWGGYVCSGTVVSDSTTGRSLILTASHCVYDDSNKAFARNVLFIPDQHNTSGSGTDTNCGNDPIGCWVADFGVVDENWTTSTFPGNVAWDYAFYVVSDTGAHSEGLTPTTDALDAAVTAFTIGWEAPPVTNDGTAGASTPDFTHGMGYSYADDPNFMYCAEDMENMDAANWWLPSCGLSGGSSGGPWLQPFNGSAASSTVISVNSWGYTTSPGMAGPKLFGTSAHCVYSAAQTESAMGSADGDEGYVASCSN